MSLGKMLSPKSKPIGCAAIVVGIVLLLTCVGLLTPDRPGLQGIKPGHDPIVAGDRVQLFSERAKVVFAATTDDTWDQMQAAIEAGSVQMMNQLVSRGAVFMPMSGTRGVVVKTSFSAYLIHIEDGEYAGDQGWVSKLYVRHSK